MLIMGLPVATSFHAPLIVDTIATTSVTGLVSTTRTTVNKILSATLSPDFPTGLFIRVLFRGPSTGFTFINEACISRPATSGDPWDSASDIANLKFGGSDGVTLGTNEERYTDWLSYTYDRTFGLIIAIDTAANSRLSIATPTTGGAAYPSYLKASVQEADDQNRGASYTNVNGSVYGIKQIEIATS